MEMHRYELQKKKKGIWFAVIPMDADEISIFTIAKALKRKYRIFDVIDCKVIKRK